MKTFRGLKVDCPYCQRAMDCSTNTSRDDRPPEEGSLSLCISCGEVGVFTAELTVRMMYPHEADEIACSDDRDARFLRHVSAKIKAGEGPLGNREAWG